jgi:hypothetical protein
MLHLRSMIKNKSRIILILDDMIKKIVFLQLFVNQVVMLHFFCLHNLDLRW